MKKPEGPHVYRFSIQVKPDDIDELEHVNNVVYIQWMQDAASAHWAHVASPEMISDCRWVVRRHEVDYYLPAVVNDRLEAFTWVDPARGPLQKRYVSLFRNDVIIAQACSTWCLLDPRTNKPRRISADIAQRLRPE